MDFVGLYLSLDIFCQTYIFHYDWGEIFKFKVFRLLEKNPRVKKLNLNIFTRAFQTKL